MGYGVIGSPTDSGSVSLGSSPGTPAPAVLAPSSSGLGRRPLKAVAPVRIRSGLRTKAHVYDVGLFACLWHADRRCPFRGRTAAGTLRDLQVRLPSRT